MILFFIFLYALCALMIWIIVEMCKSGKVLVDCAVRNPVIRFILYIPIFAMTIICLAVVALIILI